MSRQKGKVVWIARDRNPEVPHLSGYNLYASRKKPKQEESGMYGFQDDFYCMAQFESITGYKLKPGECRRVRIKIEEVR